MPDWLLPTLRSRLLFGVSLGWLALVVALLGYSHITGGALAKRENLTHLAYEAELIADQLQRSVEDRQRALARLRPNLSADDPELLDKLRSQEGLLALFDRLMVFDAEGEPVAAWPPFEHGGPNVAERDYFRDVRGFRRPLVSEPYRGGETGIDQVMVIEPLLDGQGNFQGILGGNTSLRNGDAFLNLQSRRIGDQGHVLLATASGQIISHPNAKWLMQPVPDAEQLLELARYGWEGTGVGHQLDGEPALMAFRQVWPADWVVGVFLPLSQVQAPIQHYATQLRRVGLATVALMLPLLWWLLGLGLAPLHRLEQQIIRVGRGHAERLTLHTSMSELRQVADAFNRLEAGRREALASRESREAFLRAVLASSPVGMFLVDMKGRVNYVNPELEAIAGYDVGTRPDSEWLRHVHREDRRIFIERWRAMLSRGEERPFQYRFLRDDGEQLWLEVQVSQVTLGETPLGFVGMVQDITERQARETKQRWEADHDPLTGCLNRRGFENRLEEACSMHRRDSDKVLSLIMMDLDHFKPVNDTAGHAAGDELLRRIGHLLQEAVREQDAVARLGGDEFALLLPGCPLEQAQEIAERVRERIAAIEFLAEGHSFRVTASIGVSRLGPDDRDGGPLVKRADRASYHAKRQGRNRVVVQDTLAETVQS
ncbi:diguanylate cyclase [Halomonas campisalis]|uniref:Diguanylate cyclase n=1 Tax=Billgrantia campisalis TaxID=74661 RepID=A0ABS9PAZ3_9GAMM|nr:diguanylate cyclase [Halomonas campisalis]MCG6658649.1 diguanylate cyclase [Halomonas campisalis]MDR5864085.1 diguanylate cyclase [Halomonas campisalis]